MRIATRGSPLARWQAETVAARLTAQGVEAELVVVETEGDIDRTRPIWELSGRGVFVKEVQAAVLDGRADVAVHSAKDMMSSPTEGLTMVGCLERGDVRDALVGHAFHDLTAGATVATGSVRRRAQLAHLRPDLRFVGVRGNMAARVAAADRDDVDAVVVAAVALERLDLSTSISGYLAADQVVPQVGQGAVAVEVRTVDEASAAALMAITDADTTRCVSSERAYLAELGGGCDLPVGAHAVLDGDDVELTVVLGSLDGRVMLRASGRSTDAEALGLRLATHLLDERGGRELLADTRGGQSA
ncbi:MAG: hydroxymethylbilane synthase [Actinomycetota bacterium]|jgi:hydroxymethylbilane synthase|nr:hydroxymethylbilane synthase [Actinomycetota bacterium]